MTLVRGHLIAHLVVRISRGFHEKGQTNLAQVGQLLARFGQYDGHMTSEIQARLNRQGWRVIERPADSAHPRIDMHKRRIHADSLEDLTQAYLQLRGWTAPADLADRVARAHVVNYWLAREEGEDTIALPSSVHEHEQRVIDWVSEGRSDLIAELGNAHESLDRCDALSRTVRSLFAQPHLTEPVGVRHTLRINT